MNNLYNINDAKLADSYSFLKLLSYLKYFNNIKATEGKM